MIEIRSYDDFAAYLGKELGVSGWHKITQQQINIFADATLDHQWIHIDAERAASESPFKKTIAHGYLTLALMPYLWRQIIDIGNLKMEINYGIENVKFGQAVTVDSEVRIKTALKAIVNLRGITKSTIDVVMELKDEKKPVFAGQLIFLYHFNS
jgi:acyl dehydratase